MSNGSKPIVAEVTESPIDFSEEKLKAEIDLIRERIKARSIFHQLELNKIEVENKLLSLEIEEKEAAAKKRNEKKHFQDKIVEFLQRWSGYVLGILGFGAGLIAFYEPIENFFDKRSKALEFKLTQDMIALVEDSKDKEKSILLLSYYEEDALPILIYFLEQEKTGDQMLIRSIKKIIHRKPEALDILTSSLKSFAERAEINDISDEMKALGNYMQVLTTLDLDLDGQTKIIDELKALRKIFEQKKNEAFDGFLIEVDSNIKIISEKCKCG